LQKDGPAAGQKRHTPITYSSDSSANKHPKTDKSQREIYQPPSGKYSNKVSSYGKFSAFSQLKFAKIPLLALLCLSATSQEWHRGVLLKFVDSFQFCLK
jgi:hypothetical protein